MPYDINQVSEHVAMLQRSGATDEQIIEFLGKAGWSLDQYTAQVQRLSEAGPEGVPSFSTAEGIAGALGQGASFGFGDEIAGGAQALIDKLGGDEAPLRDIYRKRRAQFELGNADWARENPTANALATGVGAIPTALAPGGPAAQIARAGVSPALRVGGAAFTGAVGGAAAGAGGAQPGERTDAAYRGALVGGAAGGVLGAGAEMLRAGFGAMKEPVNELADYVTSVVRGRSPGSAGAAGAAGGPGALPMGGAPASAAPAASPAASRAVANRALDNIERDGMTPLGLLGSSQAARAGGTPMNLAELGGPNLQGAARATVTMPGQGRALAEAGMLPSARPSAQRGRLEGQLEGLAGRPIPGPAELADDILARKQRRRGDYRALSNQQGPVADEELVEALQSRPIYREAFERENASRARTGEGLPALFDAQGRLVRSPTIDDFQAIKTQMDAEVYGAQGILTPETARAKAAVGRVEGARRELVEQADRAAPDYARVRAAAGEDFEVERAAEMARDISKLSPQEVADFFRGASKDAAATFRAQAMLSLRDKLLADSDRGAYPALVRDLWGSGDGKMAAVMKQVFGGDSRRFGEFSAAMERELQKARARNFMFGGSNTANKLAEVADLQGGDFEAIATNLAWGGPQAAATGAFARWAGKMAGRQQAGWTEGTRDELAQRLFTDPAEASDDFLRLLDRIRQEREAAMRGAGATLGASTVAGAQTGRPGAGP